MLKDETIGIGRRKTSVSSVRMRRGTGIIDVNGRPFEEYFPLELQRESILAPLKKFDNPEKMDLLIRVKGGGVESQAIATRLGVSRALVPSNAQNRGKLKKL